MDDSDSDGAACDDLEALVAAACALVDSARMHVCILSDALDARLYGAAALTAALQSFLLRHERVRLQILVADPERAATQRRLPLIEVVRRLPSRAEFRVPDPPALPPPGVEQWVGDERALLTRDPRRGGHSQFRTSAPRDARLAARRFSVLWDAAQPAAALRALQL